MFKGIDYIPNVSSVNNNIAPMGLGNSNENKTKPKSVCGCKNTVSDEAPVKFDYMTHLYISSLAVIGLFALYRLIHKVR